MFHASHSQSNITCKSRMSLLPERLLELSQKEIFWGGGKAYEKKQNKTNG